MSRVNLALGLALALAAATPAAAETWQGTVAAAEKEGSVVVISPPVPTHRATIEGFRQAYPKIDLQVSSLATPEWSPRINSERAAGIYAWDAMVAGASPTTYTHDISLHWIAPVRDVILPENSADKLWLAGFDASFLDKEKKYVFAFQAALQRLVYVNRSVLPESQFASMSGLLDPAFKGRIAMFDPRVGGPGGSAAALLLIALGHERTEAFFRDQALVFTTTPRQLDEWVVRGEYPIGLGLGGSDLIDFQKRGLAKDVLPLPVPPEAQFVTPQWGVLFLFDHAPHPNAAKVFVNWMLSRDAQSDWATRSRSNSRRLDTSEGDPGNVVDPQNWTKSLDLSAEGGVPVRTDVQAIVSAAFK